MREKHLNPVAWPGTFLCLLATIGCTQVTRPTPSPGPFTQPPPSTQPLVLKPAPPPPIMPQPGGLQVVKEDCQPLDWEKWNRSPALVVHEATTCEYRVTWTWWNPPRDYTYKPDAGGFVSDYFISGSGYHGRVFWNMKTNAVFVRPIEGRPLDEAGARDVAEWAKTTNFPPINMSTFEFIAKP